MRGQLLLVWMAGQEDSLAIKCRSCRPQASVRPQTGFTGDLETGPLVKSQSSRPEEFRVQETRAWGGKGCLEVKVEPSDSVNLHKICKRWIHTVVFKLGRPCYIICLRLYGCFPACLWIWLWDHLGAWQQVEHMLRCQSKHVINSSINTIQKGFIC